MFEYLKGSVLYFIIAFVITSIFLIYINYKIYMIILNKSKKYYKIQNST